MLISSISFITTKLIIGISSDYKDGGTLVDYSFLKLEILYSVIAHKPWVSADQQLELRIRLKRMTHA